MARQNLSFRYYIIVIDTRNILAENSCCIANKNVSPKFNNLIVSESESQNKAAGEKQNGVVR
jgi:hypothetical protein